jgi:hypothetical protein
MPSRFFGKHEGHDKEGEGEQGSLKTARGTRELGRRAWSEKKGDDNKGMKVTRALETAVGLWEVLAVNGEAGMKRRGERLNTESEMRESERRDEG